MSDYAKQEPEAMRYGFDGFGYRYIDSGSGSDWRTRHPDAEPLYAQPQTDDRYGKIHTDGSRSGGQPLDDSIEAKALALVNEARRERNIPLLFSFSRKFSDEEALCRAIEQHEADKAAHASQIYAMHSRIALAEEQLEAFKQKVSDAVEAYKADNPFTYNAFLIGRFIIPKPKPKPKPDPLLGIVEWLGGPVWGTREEYVKEIHAALEARGLEIREKGQ